MKIEKGKREEEKGKGKGKGNYQLVYNAHLMATSRSSIRQLGLSCGTMALSARKGAIPRNSLFLMSWFGAIVGRRKFPYSLIRQKYCKAVRAVAMPLMMLLCELQ